MRRRQRLERIEISVFQSLGRLPTGIFRKAYFSVGDAASVTGTWPRIYVSVGEAASVTGTYWGRNETHAGKQGNAWERVGEGWGRAAREVALRNAEKEKGVRAARIHQNPTLLHSSTDTSAPPSSQQAAFHSRSRILDNPSGPWDARRTRPAARPPRTPRRKEGRLPEMALPHRGAVAAMAKAMRHGRVRFARILQRRLE